MAEAVTPVEIPNRALFKAAEVCDLVKVQPYVLRTWEAEFPELGVAKSEGGARVYRREDIEQVVRIKHLLLVEGLTLAGARRKLQEASAPVAVEAPVIDELMGQHARERLTEVKRGLQSILELLAGRAHGHASEFHLTPPVAQEAEVAARSAAPRPKATARDAAETSPVVPATKSADGKAKSRATSATSQDRRKR
jgi:DNA-binding transcriptional MerR regulator